MMIANVLYCVNTYGANSIMGVVLIDKKYPTMYDQHDAVTKWLEEHLHATNINVWGGRVTFTAGGAHPYDAEYQISRVVETVIISEQASS